MGAQSRLHSVLADAALTLDERYDGYQADVARALAQAIRAQTESPTDASRSREVDKIVESLGQQLRSRTAT